MAIASDVSVALCTYNGAEFIDQQLRGIAAQTLLPAEIVISDDASNDDTLKVVKSELKILTKEFPEFSKVDVKVLENKSSLGVTKNFEQAMTSTNGSIIVLCDQDDLWLPNKIQRMVKELKNPEIAFVFGDAELIDEDNKPLGHSLFDALALKPSEKEAIVGKDPVQVLIKRNIITGATSAVRRSVFDMAVPFPDGWVHDEWLAMVAAMTGKHFAVTEPLIGYRQHSQNQIGVKKNTTATRMGRLSMNGRERNARLLRRAEQLNARVTELGATQKNIHRSATAVKFQRARNKFATSRLLRFPQVVALVFTGRYFSVSNGARDVLRDIVQPLGSSA